MLFNCLAFSKVTTFTCSFGALGVTVFVFNMSFPRADVRGLGFVREADGADWCHQSLLSRSFVIFSACQALLDFPGPDQCPYGLSKKLQNYCAKELVVKCAGEQQLLRLQKKTITSDGLVCLANRDKSWTL